MMNDVADSVSLTPYSYFVFMPDLFYGDPIPLNRPGDFDIMKWMNGDYSESKIAHKPPVVDPIIEKSIKEMKSKHGVKVGRSCFVPATRLTAV